MAKLSSKKKSAPVEEAQVEEAVVENAEEKEPVITQEEKEAIQKSEEKKKEEGANTKRLELATGVVSTQFNLGNDYKVTKFDDKGKVVNMTLENNNFVLSVQIKDSERHGMYVE